MVIEYISQKLQKCIPSDFGRCAELNCNFKKFHMETRRVESMRKIKCTKLNLFSIQNATSIL